MGFLKGITVKLIPRLQTGTDSIGNPIWSDGDPISVDNVLVAPLSSQELLETVNLYGKKGTYKIAIPKGDTNVWEDQIVEFFGHRWHVFTVPQKGIESMIPLEWNDTYEVGRYE